MVSQYWKKGQRKKRKKNHSSNLKTIYSADVDEASLLELLSQAHMLKSLCLRDTHLTDDALYSFLGSCLEMLDISNTMVLLVTYVYQLIDI